MGQNLYFSGTCDPVDLTQCSEYYFDPCDCRKFYHCDRIQSTMFNKSCTPEEIYNHKVLVCDHPKNAICQPTRPWERCNVTESRKNQLFLICGNNVTNSNSSSSSQNTNNTNMQLMQTLLPAALVPAVSIIIIIIIIIGFYLYKTSESEIQHPDPSIQEDNLYEIIRYNPVYGVYDVCEPANITILRMNRENQRMDYDNYVFREDISHCRSTTPQLRETTIQGMNLQDEETISSDSYSSVRQSGPTARLSTMLLPSDAAQSANKQDAGTVSSKGSSYLDVTESELPSDAAQSANKQDAGTVSSKGSSYLDVTESDSTVHQSASPRPSDTDRKSTNKTVHSVNTQEEEIVSVRQSNSLFGLGIPSNGP